MVEEFFPLLPSQIHLENSRKKAYKAMKIIDWKYGFSRKDIGIKNK